MKTPCYECEDRATGCHGRCEKYAAFRAKCDEISAKRQQDWMVASYKIQFSNRFLKRRN